MSKAKHQFEEVYQANYPKVVRMCMGYVNGDEDLAKDLAQEVFIKVWEHLPKFRNESSLSTWIYRITVNTCLIQLRIKKRTVSMEQFDVPGEETDERQASRENQLKQLYACIAKLPEESKSIVLLELEGLPQKEIALITGRSYEAVRVRLHRIKNSLTQCVQDDNI
ncbi:RNA polymerase sigma factor [Arenibacter sp. GZD96]|uniref:RNA polymerase sigma factor n=1 Tax=Aurantibrevibacter litoralis TaxID=3106030 RepID=UPI002AFFD8E8|nr:RNA polymerase sigma factor [Arenibacter sp. GZD-96]MEA1786650.1 RNA polymerase sigma factor [Arenibacter sp. GZD-96]